MKRVCFDENERKTEGQDEGASEREWDEAIHKQELPGIIVTQR